MNDEQKKRVEAGLELPLMEAFYTLQGEGAHTGRAAYFVRIGGCDVGCHWCDVKESWDSNLHPPTNIESIVEGATAYSKTIVVTGGEPFMWNMKPLTDALHSENMNVHVETSGAYPVSGDWDWVCLSPKKTMPPKPEFYAIASELKVIIYNQNDLKWAEQHAALVNDNCVLYLQPEWSRRDVVIPIITEYVMKNPKWQVSLQTHKYLGIP